MKEWEQRTNDMNRKQELDLTILIKKTKHSN